MPGVPSLRGRYRCAACLIALLLPSMARAEAPLAPLVRVAIYDHTGGAKPTTERLKRFLTESAGFQCRRVTPADIQAGCLRDFDVLIMPGGSARKEAEHLGVRGRDHVRAFVKNGGGYVGICAGSYLATPGYPWSLGLINAQVVDRAHWARGNGTVSLKMTPTGQRALQDDSRQVRIHYAQGPLLAPGHQSDLPAFESLATYATGIAKHGAPRGVMVGTTAIARAEFGKGRVVCYSPHPEAPGGPHHLLAAGIRWAAGQAPRLAIHHSISASTTASAAERLAQTIDALDVEHHWRPGERVYWRSGQPVQPRRYFKTHCSAFVAAACDRLGVYILRPPAHGQLLLANAQQAWILKQGAEDGWKEVTAHDREQRWKNAQELANQGYVVVASYRNRDRHKPGHVAIVRPSAKSAAKIAEEGPQVAWAGRSNSSDGTLLRGFGSHPKNEIRFFYHRSNVQ
jgi:glutamine amidotransferase-like uncharacterized protein